MGPNTVLKGYSFSSKRGLLNHKDLAYASQPSIYKVIFLSDVDCRGGPIL